MNALPEVLHYNPDRPCCETPAAADFFPDLQRLEANKVNRGRVASISVESPGMTIQEQGHRLTIDEAVWNECVKHPNFRACYDLSMARLVLQQALFGLQPMHPHAPQIPSFPGVG